MTSSVGVKNEIGFWTVQSYYGWLSNFYPSRMIIDKTEYRNVESFYQSQKYEDRGLQEYVRSAIMPAVAKQRGRAFPVRPDWEQVKVEVMLKGLRAKFQQNPELRQMLLATGDAVLYEDSPTDLFWGKKGQDMLGKLLMRVRSEISRDAELAAWANEKDFGTGG